MHRISIGAALAAIGIVGAAQVPGQTAAERSRYEVAAIKSASGCDGPGRSGSGQGVTPGRLNLECSTLEGLIRNAYWIFRDPAKPSNKVFQISGAPAWVATERYSIVAKAEGNPTRAQMLGPMLQTLLEERFALKLHSEMREAPIYTLTVVKGGLKAKETPPGSCVPADGIRPAQNLAPQSQPNVPPLFPCGGQRMRASSASVSLNGTGMTLADLAAFLSIRVGKEVVDATGVKGMFDFKLDFARDDAMSGFAGGAAATTTTGDVSPSIFTAIEEQLGLKLTAGKGPVEFLVIDRVERPAEN